MARKGRDLFELLQVRARGDQPPPRRAARDPADALRAAGDWLRGLLPQSRGRSPARRRRAGRGGVPAAPPALRWAALALGCAGAGFALGRWTADPADAAEPVDLRSRIGADSPQEFPPRPGPSAGDLSAQEEVKTLSQFFLPVLHYPDSERTRASRLAHHLRQHNVTEARIKHWPSTTPGVSVWAVFAYVVAPTDAAAVGAAPELLQRLKAVPIPDFEPRLRDALAGLSTNNLCKRDATSGS
jgi:hypothetical protein